VGVGVLELVVPGSTAVEGPRVPVVVVPGVIKVAVGLSRPVLVFVRDGGTPEVGVRHFGALVVSR